MKAFCAVTAMTMAGTTIAASTAEPSPATHRYLIERTFPAGAIDGVDAAVKKKVNANNATLNVTWEKSYANPDKTKLYCVYDGPSEAAVRGAAKLNGLPVDNVTEIPADIKSEPRGAVQRIAAGNHRYLVKRAGAPGASANSDSKYGVTLLTSYATADKQDSYWVYEAPSFSAVDSAAKASGAPFESIAEIPETVYPH
ncbi:MAG TPA: nickel-binding protein [Steroidobacteraceae bacterium]|nr:nickel-binding protein [Steroidobacteraceae bacterium]